jgi:hypothetical protein
MYVSPSYISSPVSQVTARSNPIQAVKTCHAQLKNPASLSG